MLAGLTAWLTSVSAAARRRGRHLRPPDGPRYELLDTAIAIGWVAAIAYVVFPPPPASAKALGSASVILGGEREIGVAVVVAMSVAAVLSYIPVRVIMWRGRGPWMIYPVKRGYQIARFATMFMAINFSVTVVVLLVDMHTRIDLAPDVPPVDAQATLRAALIYSMIYWYAFRRLKRDNRVYA